VARIRAQSRTPTPLPAPSSRTSAGPSPGSSDGVSVATSSMFEPTRRLNGRRPGFSSWIGSIVTAISILGRPRCRSCGWHPTFAQLLRRHAIDRHASTLERRFLFIALDLTHNPTKQAMLTVAGVVDRLGIRDRPGRFGAVSRTPSRISTASRRCSTLWSSVSRLSCGEPNVCP
jgi:hypothetical protein